MPLYRFEIDVTEPPDTVAMRLQSVTRERRGFLDSLREAFGRSNKFDQVFVGTVGKSAFRIERDITYRNSFLPQISGRIMPISRGSRISVTMFIHPLVVAFMFAWFSMAGFAVLEAITKEKTSDIYFSAGMFLFGALLTLGGFIPEAVKAKRLLVETIKKETTPNNTFHPTRQKAWRE